MAPPTSRITTSASVPATPSTTQSQVRFGAAIRTPRLLEQAARLLGEHLIVVALAETRGIPEMFGGCGPCAFFERELTKFQVRAALDPLASFHGKRFLQVGARLGRAAKQGARRAALVYPDRVLSKHPRPRVSRKTDDTFTDKPLGLRRSACTKIRRAALEPHQAVLREPLAQHDEQFQRFVISLLAVVEQH